MPEEEYDLAGFTVGIVDKDKIIDGSKLQAGDVIVGVASSGVHSNGFSLVRKALGLTKEKLEAYHEALGCTLGEALLEPTRLYVKPVLAAIEAADVKAISHITGGGLLREHSAHDEGRPDREDRPRRGCRCSRSSI